MNYRRAPQRLMLYFELDPISAFFTEDKLSPCQEEQREALKNYHLGVFVPRCKEDGNYEIGQCGMYENCWCVRKDGSEVPNTRSLDWPDCEPRGRLILFLFLFPLIQSRLRRNKRTF